MANGSAALQTLAPEPAPQGMPESKVLGEAMVNAAITICRATLDHQQTGEVDPAIKAIGAGQIARVSMLMLDHEPGDDDFMSKARAAGRSALRRYFTAGDLQRHSEADAAIDMCVEHLLVIVANVVRDERVLRAARAH